MLAIVNICHHLDMSPVCDSPSLTDRQALGQAQAPGDQINRLKPIYLGTASARGFRGSLAYGTSPVFPDGVSFVFVSETVEKSPKSCCETRTDIIRVS